MLARFLKQLDVPPRGRVSQLDPLRQEAAKGHSTTQRTTPKPGILPRDWEGMEDVASKLGEYGILLLVLLPLSGCPPFLPSCCEAFV